MIKELHFRGKVIKDYYINSETAEITNKDGLIKNVHIPKEGYPYICIGANKSYPLHQLMGHTFLGYFKRCIIHHKDGDTFNNSLSNLQLMTLKEHMLWHSLNRTDEWKNRNRNSQKGKQFSEEHLKNLRAAHAKMKGSHWWHKEGEKPVRALESPGDGWKIGRK